MESLDAETVAITPHSSRPWSQRERILAVAKVVLGLALLFALVGFLGKVYRPELEAFGQTLVAKLGYSGIAVGTFLADGAHFPVPPQFYMLAVISSGGPALPALVALAIGSVIGGHLAYGLADRASRISFVRSRTKRVAALMRKLMERHGTWALVIGSALPIPYSFLCYMAGLNRLRYGSLALLCALRLPKLCVYWLLIEAGWRL